MGVLITDRILHHEDRREVAITGYLAEAMFRNGRGVPPPAPATTAGLPTVVARIDDGRWLVDCPSDYCNGAVVVSATVPLYICPDCGSPDTGWCAVVYPDEKADIEALLLARPQNMGRVGPLRGGPRFWFPHETLDDLARENRELGVG